MVRTLRAHTILKIGVRNASTIQGDKETYKETFFRMIKVKTCVQLKQGQGDRLMVYKT